MTRARAFFFICAGIFLLVLSYHLGATSARAQTGSAIECAGTSWVNGVPESQAVIGRFVHVWPPGSGQVGGGSDLDCTQPVPGTAPVVACTEGYVVLGDGTIYQSRATSWVLVGAFPVGPTPSARASFGQLKARYR